METITSLNLYQRLARIMAAVGYVQKDGTNSFHKYKYASEAAILDKLRVACVDHGVMILPSVTSQTSMQAVAREGKDYPGDIAVVEVTYQLINIDTPSDTFTVKSMGYGQDKGDKGIYKALTGAYKYFALKTFQISTGDDPEKEHEQKVNDKKRGAAKEPLTPKPPVMNKPVYWYNIGEKAPVTLVEKLEKAGCVEYKMFEIDLQSGEELELKGFWKSPAYLGEKLDRCMCDAPDNPIEVGIGE